MSTLRNAKLTRQDGDRPHPHLKLPRFKWNSGFYTIHEHTVISMFIMCGRVVIFFLSIGDFEHNEHGDDGTKYAVKSKYTNWFS